MTLEKTSRLITFIHHILKAVPIVANSNNKNNVFPLGVFIEEITPTLSLTPSTNQSSWIIMIQFLLSCLRSCPQQSIFNAGCTTPILLGIVKHIILELDKLPTKYTNSLQEKCFLVGKELLDLFLIRDNSLTEEILEASNTLNSDFIGVGTLSYFDVIYSVSFLIICTFIKLNNIYCVVSRIIWSFFKYHAYINYCDSSFDFKSKYLAYDAILHDNMYLTGFKIIRTNSNINGYKYHQTCFKRNQYITSRFNYDSS